VVEGQFFTELDDSKAGAAIDGGILVESSAFHQVGDKFDIDLEEVAGARDGKGSAVAFRVGFSFAGQAMAFEDFADGKGERDPFVVLVKEELAEAHGSQVGFSTEGYDPAAERFFDAVVGVMRPAGTIEKGRAICFALGPSILPLVEGFS